MIDALDRELEEIVEPEPDVLLPTRHRELPPMPPEIAAAITKVMGSIKKLHRADKNEFAKYRYTSADDFFEAVGPLMADAGLIIIPQQAAYSVRTVAVERGQRTILIIDWDFYLGHSSGAVWMLPLRRTVTVAEQGSAQQWGSAQTYAIKQFLRALLLIPTGDADADADEPMAPAPPKRRVPPPGYDPTPPEYRAAKNANAAEGTEKPSQVTGTGADIVSTFLTALAHQTDVDSVNTLSRQFRATEGYNKLSKEQKDRCAAAYNQILDKVQRHRAEPANG